MGRRRTRSTRQAVNEAELDRISCLPGNVMDEILSHLTIKEAVRTSVYLIGRSIKELVLHVFLDKLYKIPWCLFSCQSLHRLELNTCLLNPPTTFEGFRNLRSLDLEDVTMTQDVFENLISGCTLLESLSMTDVNLTQINIHAPNLRVFRLFGNFEDISFDDTFQLTKVFVRLRFYLNSKSNRSSLNGCSSNLLKFFGYRPHIQHLEISRYFIKYLAEGVVPVKLPTPCINLRYLSLCINFNDLKEISAALCLLRSSPNLRTLAIHARFQNQTVVWTPESYCWEEIFSRPAMSIGVRHVNVFGISGTKPELDFIRFLLLYLPVLETMHLKTLAKVTPELAKELIRFKRTSGEAEVIWAASL